MAKRKKPESIALLAAYDDDSEGEEGHEAAGQPVDTAVEDRLGEGANDAVQQGEGREASAAALPTTSATTPASIRSGGILGIADYEGEGLSPEAGEDEGFGRAILAEDEPPSTPQVFANHPVDAAPKVGLTPPPMDGTPLRQGESSTPAASPTSNKWLLPSPPGKCDPKLQSMIVKFLDIKERKHILINTELRRSKAYRNPDFLSHAVETFEIDELGTQLPKEKFDPRGMDPADFYDALAAEQRREAERKEAQRKPATRVDFVQGGVQRTAVGVPATLSGGETRPSVGMPRLSAQTASGGSAAGDTVAAGAKAAVAASKKSKWDKVESSRPPLPASAPAASNYATYALQKRKEAEERAKSQKRH